jgi:DNA-binding NtrC family response regulator
MREPSSYKLLVIDDEPALVKLMKTYLGRLGYQVEAFSDGNEAWRTFQANPCAYDLVIADLTMPGFDVEQVLPCIPALNSKVRVLVCSGHPYEIASLPKAVRPHFNFLQKPFIPKMLAEAVTDTLSRATPCAAVV